MGVLFQKKIYIWDDIGGTKESKPTKCHQSINTKWRFCLVISQKRATKSHESICLKTETEIVKIQLIRTKLAGKN